MTTDSKRVALDAIDWLWGTVKGSFNEKMDTSQIIVDAVIGMIPLVGDVTAARDLIAITLGLAGDEKKREDKMQWVLLVIFVFALIPVFGGVVKGVARLALEITEDVAKNAKVLEQVVTFLNRVGHGNAVKWLKEIDVLKYQAQLIERFHALIDTMVTTLERLKAKLSSVLPDAMVAMMNLWSAGLKKVRQISDKMIPDALKELNAKLIRLQQLVYRGEWHAVTAGTHTATTEAEARIVEAGHAATKAAARGGWEQNIVRSGPDAKAADEAALAKVYQPKKGFPDLANRKGPLAGHDGEFYSYIAAFSGPITAAELHEGTYLLRIHIPGKQVGPWWVRMPPGVTEANWREFMTGGKQWREVLAVLDEFSKNGGYSIVKVKKACQINAWEGKAAEQFGITNAAQHLPGGLEQLYFEAWHESFEQSIEWLAKDLQTGWKDLEGVGYPAVEAAGGAHVEKLAEHEHQVKRPKVGGAR